MNGLLVLSTLQGAKELQQTQTRPQGIQSGKREAGELGIA